MADQKNPPTYSTVPASQNYISRAFYPLCA